MPSSSLLFKILLEVLDKTVRKEKEVKGTQRKKSNYPCLQLICFYTKGNQKTPPRDSQDNLAELYNMRSAHKTVFVYTNNAMADKELLRSILFIIATKKRKHLGIN